MSGDILNTLQEKENAPQIVHLVLTGLPIEVVFSADQAVLPFAYSSAASQVCRRSSGVSPSIPAMATSSPCMRVMWCRSLAFRPAWAMALCR